MAVRNFKKPLYVLVFLTVLAALSVWIWSSFSTPSWIRSLETEIFGNFASPSNLKACPGIVVARYPNHSEFDYSTTIDFNVKQSGWEQGRADLSINDPFRLNVIWPHLSRYDQLISLALKSGSPGQDIVANVGPDYEPELMGKKWVDGEWTVVILKPVAGTRLPHVHLIVTKGELSNVHWATSEATPTQPAAVPR